MGYRHSNKCRHFIAVPTICIARRNCEIYMVCKGKVPPGCHLAEPVTQVTRFYMPLEPNLGTICHELCTLSGSLCGSVLILTPQMICLRCVQLNLQTFACFVPSIIYNLTGAVYSPQLLSHFFAPI